MSVQAPRRQVEYVDEPMEDVEASGRQHHASMLRSPRSGEAKSDSESKKGSAEVAHEVDVERASIGYSGREAVIPRARRQEHPQTVGRVEQAEEPENFSHGNPAI